jgi:hypothetical protein
MGVKAHSRFCRRLRGDANLDGTCNTRARRAEFAVYTGCNCCLEPVENGDSPAMTNNRARRSPESRCKLPKIPIFPILRSLTPQKVAKAENSPLPQTAS